MSLPCGTFNQSYAENQAIVRTKMQWVILISALVLLFCMPLYTSVTLLMRINVIGIFIVAVLGLQVLIGYTGQISLGQAAFMMVGAYTSFLLSHYWNVTFWIALPLAGVSAGFIGLIFGMPSLRIKGFYLAMATLAAQFIIPWLVVNVAPDITGGMDTVVVSSPRLGNLAFQTQQSMFYIIMVVMVLSIFFIRNIVRTRLGRALIAIRDNDLAAEVMGINTFRYKLIAFFICSFYAGIAGSLWAHWMRCISVEHFTLDRSIWLLGMLIVGGLGKVSGAVMGAIFFQALEYVVMLIRPWMERIFDVAPGVSSGLEPAVFGLVVMLFLIFEPKGLAHRWELTKMWYRLWPFSY